MATAVQELEVQLRLNTQAYARQVKNAANLTRRMTLQFQVLGGALARTIALPAAALGAAVIQATNKYQTAMNRVQALTGATGREFERLTAKAREMGRTTAFSAVEAADAMGFLAQTGFNTSEIIDTLRPSLNLAAAGMLTAAESADILSNVLKQFGLSTREAGRVADTLAATASASNVSVRQLAESFKLAGATAKIAGQGLEEISAILGKMGDAGIQGSLAGTAVNRALLDMVNRAPKAEKALNELQIAVKNTDGSFRSLLDVIDDLGAAGANIETLGQIFETRALRAVFTILEIGTDNIRDFQEEITLAKGAAEAMANVMLSRLPGALRRIKARFQELAIELGERGGIIEGATAIVDMMTRLAKSFADVSDQTKRQIVTYTIMAAGLAILLPAFAGLTSAISILSSILSGFIAAMSALAVRFLAAGAAMSVLAAGAGALATPIGAVVTIIAGAIGLWFAFSRSVDFAAESLLKVKEAADAASTPVSGISQTLLAQGVGEGLPTTRRGALQSARAARDIATIEERRGNEELATQMTDLSRLYELMAKRMLETSETGGVLTVRTQALIKANTKLGSELSLIGDKAAIFGSSFDSAAAKADLLKGIIIGLFQAGIRPGDKDLDKFIAKWEKFQAALDQGKAVEDLVKSTLRFSNALKSVATQTAELGIADPIERELLSVRTNLESLAEAFADQPAKFAKMMDAIDKEIEARRGALEMRDFVSSIHALGDGFEQVQMQIADLRIADPITRQVEQARRQLIALALTASEDVPEAFDGMVEEIARQMDMLESELRLVEATKEIEQQAAEAARILERPFLRAAENIQDAFADAFEDLFKGSIRGFEDLADRILDVFLELASQIAAAMVVKPILQGIGFGGGGSGSLLGGLGGIARLLGGGSTITLSTGAVVPVDAQGNILSAGGGGGGLLGGFSGGLSGSLLGAGLGLLAGAVVGLALNEQGAQAALISGGVAGGGLAAASFLGASEALGVLSVSAAQASGSLVSLAGAATGVLSIAAAVAAVVGGIVSLATQDRPFDIGTQGRAGVAMNTLTLGTVIGGAAGLALGASIGSAVIPGIGTLLGAVVGGLVGWIVQLASAEPVTSAAQLQTAASVESLNPFSQRGVTAVETPFGAVGIQTRRFSDLPGGTAQGILDTVKAVDDSIAAILSPEDITRAAAALQGYQGGITQEQIDKVLAAEGSIGAALSGVLALGGGGGGGAGFGIFSEITRDPSNDIGALIIDRIATIMQAVGADPSAYGLTLQQTGGFFREAQGEALNQWILDRITGAQELRGLRLERIPQGEVDIANLTVKFNELLDTLPKAGFAIEEVTKAFEEGLATLSAEFARTTAIGIFQITNPLRATFLELERVAEDRLKNATALGVELVEIERLNMLERAAAIEQALAPIDDFLASLSGDASLFGIPAALEEAAAAFDAALLTFDPSQAASAADAFLGVARDAFASSGDFFSIFDDVTARLEDFRSRIASDIPVSDAESALFGGEDAADFGAEILQAMQSGNATSEVDRSEQQETFDAVLAELIAIRRSLQAEEAGGGV